MHIYNTNVYLCVNTYVDKKTLGALSLRRLKEKNCHYLHFNYKMKPIETIRTEK